MTAPILPELQRLFWRSLAREPDAPEARGLEPELVALISSSATLAPAERLQIYADMYLSRIRDALREDFPQVAARLGEGGFDALVRDYVRDHPSEHPSLRHVGRHLPGFLAARARPGVPPFLADLARLEWARVEVFDAPDEEPVTDAELGAVPPDAWPELRFTAVAALEVVRSGWPIHQIWASADVAPDPARTAVRVWREGWVVYHARMDALEEGALERLLAGKPFEAICEVFADLPTAEAGALAVGMLRRWVEDGLIASLQA